MNRLATSPATSPAQRGAPLPPMQPKSQQVEEIQQQLVTLNFELANLVDEQRHTAGQEWVRLDAQIKEVMRRQRLARADLQVAKQKLGPAQHGLQPGQELFTEIVSAVMGKSWNRAAYLLQSIEDPEAKDLAGRCDGEARHRERFGLGYPQLSGTIESDVIAFVEAFDGR